MAQIDFFGQVEEGREPTLKSLIEAGDLSGASKLIESLPFFEAQRAALMVGFSVTGTQKQKTRFYADIGRQLVIACESKTLPAIKSIFS